MPTLGGYICVRNGDELDYCWREAVASLLPVCDEVLICDSDSTDGTREAADRMADQNPKIRVINMPWENPKGDGQWWVKWLNFARKHLTTHYQISLDADEHLSNHPDCHNAIREALAAGLNEARTFNRLNFWRDASHLIPEGHCCGKWVTRFGRTDWWMPSDEGHSAGELPILDEAQRDPRLEIFHLGFLRRKDAFFRKAKVVLGAFFNNYDQRLAKLEAEDKPLADVGECEWTSNIVPWQGYMPDAVEQWLSDRGHTTKNYVPMTEQEALRRIRIAPYEKGDTFTVCHCGDLGDLTHALPTIKAIAQVTGPVQILVLDRNQICKRIIHRLPAIAPLLVSQDYILEIKELADETVQWDAGSFRHHHSTDRSLAWAHLQHYRGQRSLPPILPDFQSPWITGITPDPRGDQRIIINRTDRYQNRHFRWQDIVKHYNTALLFVGTREEHAAFTSRYGAVDYLPTANLLEVASLIAASPLFIGNQSACFAVAEGMKHRRLLEACLYQPDVMVAKEPNFIPCGDGGLDLPPLCGRTALKYPPNINKVDYLKNPHTQPRSGWKLDDMRDVSYSMLKRQVKRKRPDWDDDKIHRAIFDALAEREPSYFSNGSQQTELGKFKAALENAL